jgi:hypothetical protein
MSIVALLTAMVGPLAINSLERAEAKQEVLTLKSWLRKVSAKAFHTGQKHLVKLDGKQVQLFLFDNNQPISQKSFKAIFFQKQDLQFNKKGFVDLDNVSGTYRGKPLKLDLKTWINGEEKNSKLL